MKKNKFSIPVYYVRERLLDAKKRYINMEKVICMLILASKKHKLYFQTHKVEVQTSFPFR